MHKLICVAFFAGMSISAFAQKKKKEVFNFEKITPAHLQTKIYPIDSSADAVVLGDVGSLEIVGNNKGWFSFVYKHRKRIHVLSKNGYDEATIEIPLYAYNGYEEKLESLKAYTYNLEGGAIVETKLEKENVFKERSSRYRIMRKFTMPNVKEGSIIDIEYKVQSDYLNTLEPWSFQGRSPRLWSELTLSVPQFFKYHFLKQGKVPFYIYDSEDRSDLFTVVDTRSSGASERSQFRSGVTDFRWVCKDVPALKEEAYTTTIKNHISHIEFQLAELHEPLTYHNYIPTWPQATKEMMNDEDFGKKLDDNNSWLNETLEPLLVKGNKLESARRIYAYVRDNFNCTSHDGIYLSQNLRAVFKARTGTVADINLLLVTMLKNAGIDASPVMLSTRSHGLVFSTFPMLTRFNYIIASTRIDDKPILLDASYPRLGFNRLMPECYNGMARVINTEATPLLLMADSLTDKRQANIIVSFSDKGEWVGSKKEQPGYFESLDLRENIKKEGKDHFISTRKKSAINFNIEKVTIDSLDRYEDPVSIVTDFNFNSRDEVIYINPMFGEEISANPFKSELRTYPVEMPYTINRTTNLTFEVPEGYVVDELPKQIRVKLNEENEGFFEYMISHSQNLVSMRTTLYFKKANFQPEEYEVLREFYNLVVAKHAEQIVLKKKK